MLNIHYGLTDKPKGGSGSVIEMAIRPTLLNPTGCIYFLHFSPLHGLTELRSPERPRFTTSEKGYVYGVPYLPHIPFERQVVRNWISIAESQPVGICLPDLEDGSVYLVHIPYEATVEVRDRDNSYFDLYDWTPKTTYDAHAFLDRASRKFEWRYRVGTMSLPCTEYRSIYQLPGAPDLPGL